MISWQPRRGGFDAPAVVEISSHRPDGPGGASSCTDRCLLGGQHRGLRSPPCGADLLGRCCFDHRPDRSNRPAHAPIDGACAMCCLAHAGASLDTPEATFFAMPLRQFERVVWLDATPDPTRFPRRLARPGPRASVDFLTTKHSVTGVAEAMPNGVVDLAGRRAGVRNSKCSVLSDTSSVLRAQLLAGLRRRDRFRFPLLRKPVRRRRCRPSPSTRPQQKRAAAARPPQRSAARAARVSRVSNPAVAAVASDLARGPRADGAHACSRRCATFSRRPAASRSFPPRPTGTRPSPTPSRTCSTTCRACSRSRNGATTPGSRSAAPGLSRNFHLRGVQLYMDGIPINTADGYGDFQEIDPTAYKYVEVYKGANALQFGANSLGGAINFVMPTGRDPFPNGVSRRYGRLRLPAGCRPMPAARTVRGTVSSPHRPRRRDGFRDHSYGQAHARQRQCRLPVLAGCRDAVLPQRQRSAAAHSGHRHQGPSR